MSHFDKMMANCRDWKDLKKLGNEAFHQKAYAQAVQAYEKALETCDENEDQGVLSSNLSVSILQLGDASAALKAAKMCIEVRPEWSKGYFRKARALWRLGKLEEAEACLLHCQSLDDVEEVNDALVTLREDMQPFEQCEEGIEMKVFGELELRAEPHGPLTVMELHYTMYDSDNHMVESSKLSMSLVGMQIAQVIDHNVPPRKVTLDEYEAAECVEYIARRLQDGSRGVLRVTGDKLRAGRPQGTILCFVKVFSHTPMPSKPEGVASIIHQRKLAESLLTNADEMRAKLDAFDKMKASEDQSKDQVLEAAFSAKKCAWLAQRRFRIALAWANELDNEAEKLRALIGLGRALIVSETQFESDKGPNKRDFGRDLIQFLQEKGHDVKETFNKANIDEALDFLDEAHTLSEGKSVDVLVAQGMAHATLGDTDKAKELLNSALELCTGGDTSEHETRIKSELARVNVQAKEAGLQDAGAKVAKMKEFMDTLMEGQSENELSIEMATLQRMIVADEIAWDALMRTKIGKTVGLIQKATWASAELKDQATMLIRKIRELAERNRPLWA
eukprot:GEMP01022616.1.p1 GENE.GEMP01022616.1~~GEMP01022616.1.p1  ORF type:complete len:562 (+),score=148.39 GEMP01022616.1:94-1779(+)